MSMAIDAAATMMQPARTGRPKEHLKRDRTAQDFGHGGGDRG